MTLPRYHMNNTRITPCLRFYAMTGQTGETLKQEKEAPAWTLHISRGCWVLKLKYKADRSLEVCVCLSHSSCNIPCAKPVYSLCYEALSLVAVLGPSAPKTRQKFGGCWRDVQPCHKHYKIYCSNAHKLRLNNIPTIQFWVHIHLTCLLSTRKFKRKEVGI